MAHLFVVETVDEDAANEVGAAAIDRAGDASALRGALPWDRAARRTRRWRVDPLPAVDAVSREASHVASQDAAGESGAEAPSSPSVALVGDIDVPLHAAPPDAAVSAGAWLAASRDEDGRVHWVALAAPDAGLRINGERVALGARVLRHRDELQCSGVAGRAVFSLEELCRVVAFDGPEGARCPRCRSEIALGAPSVRCPRCRTAYHEADDRHCWTYAPTCAHDDQSTALDAGYRFRPAEEDIDD